MEIRPKSPTSGSSPSSIQALEHHKSVRCIVKIGGAAITCKNELERINEGNLGSVCSQLREAMELGTSDVTAKVLGMDWSRRTGVSIDSVIHEFGEQSSLDSHSSFILVHGAGSFGHFQASKSGVNKGGLHLPLVRAGFVATRISVTSLNLEIVRALAREGITAVGMSPFACGWSTKGRNTVFADVSQIKGALCAGFIPVLHGDAILDHSQGCTILSGDVIIRHLAQHLFPEYVVFLTDVLGVYDRPPAHHNARLLREIAVDEEGNWSIVNPSSEHDEMEGLLTSSGLPAVMVTAAPHDTTGGMETKMLEAVVIAKLGVDVYITKAGTEHSLRALKGEVTDGWLGTIVRSVKKVSPVEKTSS